MAHGICRFLPSAIHYAVSQVIEKCHESWKKLLDGGSKPGRKWVPGHLSLREKTFAMIKPDAVKRGVLDEAQESH